MEKVNTGKRISEMSDVELIDNLDDTLIKLTEAHENYLTADYNLDNTEASIYMSLKEDGEKRTENELKSKIKTNPKYLEAVKSIIKAEVEFKRYQNLLDVLKKTCNIIEARMRNGI